jgi:hypothetical protein
MGINANPMGGSEAPGTRVLLASLNPVFAREMAADKMIYFRHYKHCEAHNFDTPIELLESLDGFDVLHLYADTGAKGELVSHTGVAMPASRLLKAAVAAGLKLLVVANDNPAEIYMNGFKTKEYPLNIVLTLDRVGDRFPRFLDALLGHAAGGATLPVAWVKAAPGGSGKIPGCIFSAGQAQALLLP